MSTNSKEYMRAYKAAHPEKFKAYRQSDNGKAVNARAQAKYRQSDKGKAYQAKYQAKYNATHGNPASVRSTSNQHAHRLLPNVKGYVVHHGFGMQRRDYLYLPKWLHDLLHTDFKKPNERKAPNDSCLWTNPAVRFYLVNSGATFYEVHGNDVKTHFPPSLLLTYSK